jgi:uncharacterized protein involved in response to NO
MTNRVQGSERFLGAHRLLFPVAVAFAAVMVPLWLAQYLRGLPLGAAAPAWHGHEMIFGYALAVVGGYLMTRVTPAALLAILVCWLAGRVAMFMPGLPRLLDIALALAYPVSLFVVAGLPFLRAAKRGRNAVFAPLIAAFSLAALVAHMGAPLGDPRRGVYLGLDLVTLLLFIMGGRVIAAATSGAMRRQGRSPGYVAQAGLERTGLIGIVALGVCDLAAAWPIAGATASALAGAAVAARLLRWRAHRLLADGQIAVLYVGYAWLGVGLFARAAAFAGAWPQPDAIHAITVGALGTLTMVMMGRATLQRAIREPRFSAGGYWGVALVSLAAVLRLAAAIPALREAALVGAGSCWTLAFLLFGIFLAGALAQPKGRGLPAAGPEP